MLTTHSLSTVVLSNRWILGNPLTRWIAQTLLRFRCRKRLSYHTTQPTERAQLFVLHKLLQQAHASTFAREHNFPRIRSHRDYCRLVPVSTELTDPHNEELRRAKRTLWELALGRLFQHDPHARPLQGDWLHLTTAPLDLASYPILARGYVRRVASGNADGSDGGSVSLLSGSATDILEFLNEVLRQTSSTRLSAVWPELSAVFVEHDTPRTRTELQNLVGPKVFVLGYLADPEGVFALEEPSTSRLCLLPGVGNFYEFLDPETPEVRLTLEEVRPGHVYELVLTSPCGAWARKTGRGICFDAEVPLAFRFVALPTVERKEEAEELPTPQLDLTSSIQPPHRPSADIPAGRQGKSDRTLWSTAWDRR